MPHWLTTRQVSEETGLSERTIQDWIASGKIRSIKIGAARRIPATELQALEERLLEPKDAS